MPYTSALVNCSMQVIAADINCFLSNILLKTSMTCVSSFQFRTAHIPIQNRQSRLTQNIFAKVSCCMQENVADMHHKMSKFFGANLVKV